MSRCLRGAAVAAMVVTALFSADRAHASLVTYQTVNDGLSPGPFFWVPDQIGWYWTPATNVMLNGIETRLTTGFVNINNNFTFTTTMFTDRPAVLGTSLGSFTWNGTAYNVDGWLGGSFSSPIALLGGTTYFIGMSGWAQALTGPPGNPTGGAGVNWIHPANQPGAQNLGAGSGYTGALWSIKMNNTATPANIDSPILRFIAFEPDVEAVPEPASATLLALGMLIGGFARSRHAALRRRDRMSQKC